jgi:Family of unknown function (DUF6365)
MRALFVTPVEHGAGETITSLHMAENIVRGEGEVMFLASPFARWFIETYFAGHVAEFSSSGPENAEIWRSALERFRPDVVVFADYPLLFFSEGVSPLAREAGWIEDLQDVEARLVTLDHTGFAQHPIAMFFGPPHLSLHYEEFPPIPEGMHILLPCPMNEPLPLGWKQGTPFRYWKVPLGITEERRRAVRQRYLRPGEDILIFHSVPTWAWSAAKIHELPYFSFLPEILDHYLEELSGRVVVVSVNNGSLLKQPTASHIRFVNLAALPTPDYEALMLSSDLMITENKISISMGKAICGLLPCVAFKNSFELLELRQRLTGRLRETVLGMERIKLGSVYRYEVFPSGMSEELEQLGLYHDNSLTRCFAELEIFGGEDTRAGFCALLVEPSERELLQLWQQQYVENVRRLPDANEVLRGLVERDRSAL